MKKTALLLIATLPFTTACLDLDFSGLGDAFANMTFGGFGGGGLGGFDYTPTLSVNGVVLLGEQWSTWDEAQVLIYAEADSLNPVDSASVSGGEYWFDFGANPTADQCAYVAQARRWDGELSPFVPLFVSPPADCVVGGYAGSTLELPEYEPLATPFEIRGRILVGGQPAGEGRVQAQVYLDRGPERLRLGPVTTDADGWYAFETTDQGVWFAACQHIWVEVSSGAQFESTEIYRVPHDRCSADARTMPDIRQGSIKAVAGRLFIQPYGEPWSEEYGEAGVELYPVSDTLRTPISGQVLDDGSYHLWFPHDMQNPGCEWEVTVFLNDVATERQLLPTAYGCAPPYYFDFWLTPGGPPPAATMSLTVTDPVGDHTGRTDAISMRLYWDPDSGEFEVRIEADTLAPFQGLTSININLYNPEAGTFLHTSRDNMQLNEPQTSFVIRGVSPELTVWRPGQQVFTNSLEGTPNPPNTTLFRTSVNSHPLGFLTNEDVIAFEDLATPAVVMEAAAPGS